MTLVTTQDLIHEISLAIESRALRIAAKSEFPFVPKVTAHPESSDPGSVPSGKTWVIVEIDNQALADLAEKAKGVVQPSPKTY